MFIMFTNEFELLEIQYKKILSTEEEVHTYLGDFKFGISLKSALNNLIRQINPVLNLSFKKCNAYLRQMIRLLDT